MAIITHQHLGLTAGSGTSDSGSPVSKGNSLTHAEMDANFNSMWPIGSIYINVANNTNPRESIGFGVWESFGQKTILVGHNDSPAGTNAATGAQQNLTGSEAGSDTIFSSEIRGATSVNGKMSINFYRNHPFAEGQRVTISGITTGSNCTRSVGGVDYIIDPNGEREILNLGDVNLNCPHGAITVDYTDPPRGSLTEYIPGPDGLKTKETNRGSVTLFGTLFNSSPAEPTPLGVCGTGGKENEQLTELNIPQHTHEVNWELAKTGNSRAAGSGDSRNDSIVSPLIAPRPPIPGGAAQGTEIRTGAGIFDRDDYDNLNRRPPPATAGSAHTNMMPFISAYFWRRKA